MTDQPSRIPTVTVEQMRRVDLLAETEFHIDLVQMMENAGRCLARLARHRFMGGDVSGRQVLVLAGPGGNGGGGLAAARRLHVWGAHVTVVLGREPERLAPVTAHQLQALQAVSVAVRQPGPSLPPHHIILDALLGYSAQGSPRPPLDDLLRQANESPAPILSLDLPSGMDPDTGSPAEPTARAIATMTLGLPKAGLFAEEAAPYAGDIWLADISLPPALFARLGLRVPRGLFAKDDLIQISS